MTAPAALEPDAHTDRWWAGNELRLHGLDWGAPGEPPLVCMHGAGEQAHSWDFFALAMRSRFHVTALDLRGHGDSDWSPDGHYRLHTYAADVHEVITQQGFEQVVLVGLSLGGLTALALAATRPEMVRALVLVDVGIELHEEGVDRLRRFVGRPERVEHLDQLVDHVRSFNPRRPKRQLRSSLLHSLRRDARGGWMWKYDKVFLRDVDAVELNVPAILNLPSRVTTPTLFVRGAESDIQSEEGARMLVRSIPNATRLDIPSAGHTVMGDDPSRFEDAVWSWLTTEPAGIAIETPRDHPC